jgi:hypothetical protein
MEQTTMKTKQIHTYPLLKEWPEWAQCATTDDNGRRDYWSNLDCYWYKTGYKTGCGAWWFGALVAKTEMLDPNTFDGIKNDGSNSKVTREEQAERDAITDYRTNLAANIGYHAFAAVPEANQTKRTHYHVEIIPGVWVDTYDVLSAFNVTNPAYQHLTKKALKAGNRGHKDLMTDAQDIIDSAIRGKQLIEKGGDL